MIFIPITFFFLFFLSSWKRKGLDLGAGLIGIYLLTSIVSGILYFSPSGDVMDDYSKIEITIVPTLIYCTLIGLSLIPFRLINTNRPKEMLVISNIKMFNLITYFYIGLFFVMILMFYNDIINGILQQDIVDLRAAASNKELENFATRQTTFIGKLFGYGCTMLGSGAGYMIAFFYYSICFTKNSTSHNLMILISSLSTIILSLIAIDRSGIIRWVMLFVVNFLIFKPYLTKQAKRLLYKAAGIIVSIMLVYFMIVTIARFMLTDGGVQGGLLSYIGQPFLNFCNLWDHAEIHRKSIFRTFPALNYFVFHQESTVDTVTTSGPQFVRLNGFETYIGFILLDLGHFWACIIPLILTYVSFRVCDSFRKKKHITLKNLVHLQMVGILVMYGCIAYYYSSMESTLNIFLILYIMSKFKFKKQLVC